MAAVEAARNLNSLECRKKVAFMSCVESCAALVVGGPMLVLFVSNSRWLAMVGDG